MVSIKDINKKIKKNLFDPLDKSKNKFSSLLKNIKREQLLTLHQHQIIPQQNQLVLLLKPLIK